MRRGSSTFAAGVPAAAAAAAAAAATVAVAAAATRLRASRGVAWIALAALLCGCDRKVAAPIVPVIPPPEIREFFPPARSTGIRDSTAIWVTFDRDLDPASLNDQTVTLRVDARYVAIDIAWDPALRRVDIEPRQQLALGRTHTVRLDRGIRTADGIALSKAFTWQFRAIGVRAPYAPQPPDGTLDESPFVRLSWNIEDAGNPGVDYELYASPESARVASRAAAPVARPASTQFLPVSGWDRGTDVFWAVTARDRATGDQADGPVWKFRTLPADAPLDTVELEMSDWGYQEVDEGGAVVQSCFDLTFETGGSVTKCAIRWDVRPYAGRKLAGAAIVMRRGARFPGQRSVTIQAASEYWGACNIEGQGAPGRAGVLAANASRETQVVSVASERLTAHVEAMMRYRGYHGYIIGSDFRQDFVASPTRLYLLLYAENAARNDTTAARPLR